MLRNVLGPGWAIVPLPNGPLHCVRASDPREQAFRGVLGSGHPSRCPQALRYFPRRMALWGVLVPASAEHEATSHVTSPGKRRSPHLLL